MTIRNFANGIKELLGTALGLYETVQPISDATQQKTVLGTLITASKNAGFLSGLQVSATDAQLSDFVLAVGPSLEIAAPVATS